MINKFYANQFMNNRMDNTSSKGFELKKHLHEQYADNSNSHFKCFISFIAAVLTLFGAYGYAYIHSPNIFLNNISKLSHLQENQIHQHVEINLESFLLLAAVVVGVLCFLTVISVFLGYAERRDQMGIRLIREEYNVKTIYSTPFGRNYCYYLASYYRFFYYALLVGQFFVIITTCLKCPLCCKNIDAISNCTECDMPFFCFSVFAFILMAVFVALSIYTKVKYYWNYLRYAIKYEGGKLFDTDFKTTKLDNEYNIVTDGDKFVCFSKKDINDIENNKSLNAKIEKLNKERYIRDISYFLCCLNHHKCFIKYLSRLLFVLVLASIAFFVILLLNIIIF